MTSLNRWSSFCTHTSSGEVGAANQQNADGTRKHLAQCDYGQFSGVRYPPGQLANHIEGAHLA